MNTKGLSELYTNKQTLLSLSVTSVATGVEMHLKRLIALSIYI